MPSRVTALLAALLAALPTAALDADSRRRLDSARRLVDTPLAGQTVVLSRASDPCVRLLNATGTVGCATRSSGSLAQLSVLHSADDLSALLASPPDGSVAVALPATLFERQPLAALQSALGANLEGILVLHAAALPAGATSPAPSRSLDGSDSHAWNALGNGLSMERFPFGIVLLSADESATLLRHAGTSTASSGREPPLLELRYPMSARDDAPSCLAAYTCLPLGGQSVWGALRPQTTAPPPPPQQWQLPPEAHASALLPGGVPAVALVAQMDATAFFHENAPGAHAAVSSLVALLAAVDAVASSPALTAQLPSLPSAPLFFLFTGEAWGGLGSRRFLTDVANFSCTTPPADAAASSPPPPASAGQREPLPPPRYCAWPPKRDLRFLELRDATLAAVLQVGPVGAVGASDALYVHTPSAHGANTVGAALHAAAAAPGAPAVLEASGGDGLPPGPARAFVDRRLGLGDPAHVATVADVDVTYASGARFGSRFDTIEGLNASRVCAASGVAARAWWALSGGHGEPIVNCTLVSELLRCLLPPAAGHGEGNGNGGAGGGPRDGDGGTTEAIGGAACPLAAELGLAAEGLTSHYSGVFISSASLAEISPTAQLAHALLTRSLMGTCEASTASATAPCEPVVLTHDAFPAGIEREPTGQWVVTDASEPLWAESNWPGEMYTILYPHGAPRTAESVGLLVGGLVGAALTYAAVIGSRLRYKRAYKRL